MKSLLLFLLLFGLGSLWSQEKPNIVFILSDDLGYKDLGCYGNPFNETSVLDNLAQEGMLFTSAYAHPACSPSRAALMTGKHPARLQITTVIGLNRTDSTSPVVPPKVPDNLPSSEITLAEILRRNGYFTGIVGKWHLGRTMETSPHAQGFDYDRVIGRNGLDYYNYEILSKGQTFFEDDGSEYLTDKLSDYAVEYLSSQQVDQPFFLYLAYSAPHLLTIPKAEKVSKYMIKYNDYKGKYNPYYATMIESMDDGIGRIIDLLEQQDLLGNTLIIFGSDNGGVGIDQIGYRPTTMEPLRRWKGHVYEGGIRVPLIIYWKDRIQPGVKNNHYMVIQDFLPTLMELIGDKDLPADLDGKSILSTIFHPDQEYKRGPVYFHFPHFSGQRGRPYGAVRDGDWKLVENFETSGTELFNLKEDISESRDLKFAHPEKTKKLYDLLKGWQEEIGAQMPDRKPGYMYGGSVDFK